MKIGVEISSDALQRGWRPPFWLKLAYREYDRDVTVYAPWGIHRILSMWRHRWWVVIPLIQTGFWDMGPEPGGYFRDGRFTFFFWRTLRRERERIAAFWAKEAFERPVRELLWKLEEEERLKDPREREWHEKMQGYYAEEREKNISDGLDALSS